MTLRDVMLGTNLFSEDSLTFGIFLDRLQVQDFKRKKNFFRSEVSCQQVFILLVFCFSLGAGAFSA